MSTKITNSFERYPWWWLGVILVGFSAVVLGNMTRWSIWFDEAFSAYIVRFNFAEITHFTAVDVHPPLYYWLLKIWTMLWGNSELAVRSLSLVFAIVALLGVFVLVRRLLNSPRAALLAALLAACSPMLVRFSHEARMYTLALAIVVWATYLLVRMHEKRSKYLWIGYGLLLVAGMATHYFVALAWLAHWAWRWFELKKDRLARFWTREWLGAHLLAVVLFAPWLPILVKQFTTVQQGFWIPSVGAYTPIDYLSNTVLYLQYGTVLGWWAALFLAVVVAGWWLVRRGIFDTASKIDQAKLSILGAMAVVPPILLFVASMPPLRSSFIDRYVMYAQIMAAVLLGIAAWFAYRTHRRGVIVALLVVLVGFGAGIYNVYYLGNYNKNSHTSIRVKEAMQAITETGETGQPIIAASPWIYYEASFYDSREHRVYFADERTKYEWGSLEMLRTSDIGKIKNLKDFTVRHRYVWVLDNREKGEVAPLNPEWQRVKNVGAYDTIDGNTKYRASLFDTQPSAE